MEIIQFVSLGTVDNEWRGEETDPHGCTVCGAAVYDTDLHMTWHEKLGT